jgi:hypothetical protein
VRANADFQLHVFVFHKILNAQHDKNMVLPSQGAKLNLNKKPAISGLFNDM